MWIAAHKATGVVRKNGKASPPTLADDPSNTSSGTYWEIIDSPSGLESAQPWRWNGSSVVTATAQEVSDYEAARVSELNLAERAQAKGMLADNPVLRKLLRAAFSVLIDGQNQLRAQHSMSQVTFQQFVNLVAQEIDSGSHD